MPTELLLIGPVISMVENRVYALPARACYIFVQNTAPQISNEGTAFSALPTNGIASAAFIRSTATNTLITLKAV